MAIDMNFVSLLEYPVSFLLEVVSIILTVTIETVLPDGLPTVGGSKPQPVILLAHCSVFT